MQVLVLLEFFDFKSYLCAPRYESYEMPIFNILYARFTLDADTWKRTSSSIAGHPIY